MLDLFRFVDSQIGHAIARDIAKNAATTALADVHYHLNNSTVAMIEVDRNFRIKSWAPQCEEIFEWRAEEVIGGNWMDLNIVHPDDQHLLHMIPEHFNDPEVMSFNLFHRNVTKSGRIVHIDWHNSVQRDQSGEVESILALGIDRSAAIEAQQALQEERDLFVTGPTMIFRFHNEPHWPITYFSPNVEEILGYSPSELESGRFDGRRIVYPDDVESLRRQFHYHCATDARQ